MRKFFLRLTVVRQLVLLGLLTLVCASALQVFMLLGNRNILLENQKLAIRDSVDTVWTLIEHIHSEAQSGQITEEQAKADVLKMVSSLSNGEHGYFWVDNMDGYVLAFPDPAYIGQYTLDTLDIKGKPFVREMHETLARDGAGFYTFYWDNPRSGKAELMVNYARTYEPWGWNLGTGLFVSETNAAFFSVIRIALIAMAIFIPIMLLAVWLIAHRIRTTAGKAIDFAGRVQRGELDAQLVIEGEDELAQVARALQSMQIAMRNKIAEEARAAAENLRIRQALDSVSAGVLVSDENDQIIYTNDAVDEIFRRGEDDIRSSITDFSAKDIMGRPIQIFEGRLCNLNQGNNETDNALGKRYYRASCNPVITGNGKRIGYVVEVRERTQEAETEQDIQRILDAAKRGDLSNGIKVTSQPGFLRTVALEMNELIRVISENLQDINEVSRALAAGKLDLSISKHYSGAFGEVAANLNQTVAHLSGMAGQLKEANAQVRITSEEMVSGNNQLSQRTESSVTQLRQASGDVNLLAGAVSENADNTGEANRLAQQARVSAQHGGQAMSEAIEAMNGINEASEQINQIISVINEIAFQTNLLALNASVEAARAGEQGRGFAVVATEVRNLAQRSATAADEIKNLIENSSSRVRSGQKLVNRAGDGLNEIREAVEQVGDLIRNVADSISEQNLTIQSVNQSVADLEVSIQQNAALAETATASSETLRQTARTMDTVVSFFNLPENGQAPPLRQAS